MGNGADPPYADGVLAIVGVTRPRRLTKPIRSDPRSPFAMPRPSSMGSGGESSAPERTGGSRGVFRRESVNNGPVLATALACWWREWNFRRWDEVVARTNGYRESGAA